MSLNLDKRWVFFFIIGVVILGGSLFKEPFNAFAMEHPKADKSSNKTDESTTTTIASSNPLSGNAEAIEQGRKLYFKWCTQCHGPKADGVSRFGKYAADLRKFWRGYNEFVTIVKVGRTEKQMPPWKDVLKDEEINQIGAYLETLAIEGANWK